ncbi:MAG: hypothetical protein Ct9H300mP13_8060 [Gammaproteobacteria bacterium]|nr:MAG: hypothetical protein Ct9H300mP13_8060 [Gammaproteobacteria bacterium]
MIGNVLLLIVVFAVAAIAFVRALFYWKRGNGLKDRILCWSYFQCRLMRPCHFGYS